MYILPVENTISDLIHSKLRVLRTMLLASVHAYYKTFTVGLCHYIFFDYTGS